MIFENKPIPDDGDLSSLVRDEILHGQVDYRGDAGDFSTLQWIERFACTSPANARRVADAYDKLLYDSDPGVVSRILEEGHRLPVDFADSLIRIITHEWERLARTRDPSRYDGGSLLGTAVDALERIGKRVLSAESAAILGRITRREDGWPASFRLAMASEPHSYLHQLNDVLARLSDDERDRFASAMVVGGPPLVDLGLEEVGRAPMDVRVPFAKAVRSFLEQVDDAERTLREAGAVEGRVGAARPTWSELAARLRVPVDLDG